MTKKIKIINLFVTNILTEKFQKNFIFQMSNTV